MRSNLRRPLLAVASMLVIGLMALAVAGCGSSNNTTSTSTDTSMSGATAAQGVEVGGAMMVPNKNIVANAMNASNVTTLVALVKQAGLVTTLEGKGPFTVFAPDNAALAKLPKATTAMLMKPAGKSQLKTILTYHVVPGEYDAAKLTKMANNGETLTTVEGGKLTPKVSGNKLTIEDESGDTVTVTQADIHSSNGITHIINGVLMPKS